MILGDDVVNKTMPAILCDEDGVAGNHGYYRIRLPEQLDYLTARDSTRLLSRCLYALFLKTPSSTRLRRFPTRVAVGRCEAGLGAEIAPRL